jgi:transcriptional regulator with XRE-family HTH domain
MEKLTRTGSTKERLAEAMQEAGKKQADLVRDTGLNKSIISRCVSGTTEPGNQTIMKLAQALNVSELWLWGYDVPKTRTIGQKKNDALADIVVKLRSDSEFFDLVSMMAELTPDQRASLKPVILMLNK